MLFYKENTLTQYKKRASDINSDRMIGKRVSMYISSLIKFYWKKRIKLLIIM